MVNSLKEENQKLTEQLESYESGLKGACSTCEPVGLLNKELTEQLEREHKHLSEHAELCKELTESVNELEQGNFNKKIAIDAFNLTLVSYEECIKDMREALGLVLKKNQIKSTYFAGMPYPSKHERIHDGRYAKTARECLEKWKDL